MSIVELQNVSKVYAGGVRAVRDVNLTVADGEFVVLVGPSGCGKSTTLRMVAGLEDISGGTVRIDGRVVNAVPPKDRDIAMVFQNYALYPYMTVYENMAFGLKLRRRELGLSRSEIDRKVRQVSDTLGLTSLLDRKPKALSGGQRQRVAVGRAIVRNPKVFLFDEPLSNLDAKLRMETRAELKKLHRTIGTTTIYVTHDQEEAMTLGDRMVVMKDGLVQQVGAPLEVYSQPVNRFVASFVGSPPMNFIPGRFVKDRDRWHLDEGSIRIEIPAEATARCSLTPGGEGVLGIRPEALRLLPAESDKPADWRSGLAGKVAVIEPLGQNMDVVFSCGSQEHLVARIAARTGIRERQSVSVCVDPCGAHLFAAGETGVNLSLARMGVSAGAA